MMGHDRPMIFVPWLLQCPSLKEESSLVPVSPCLVGIGLLALRMDTLFTPALEKDRSFYLSFYLSEMQAQRYTEDICWSSTY
jgi:hypothetical protein